LRTRRRASAASVTAWQFGRREATAPCWARGRPRRGRLGGLNDDDAMTVVRINAITVLEKGGEELARRFTERAGAVDRAEGFEGFELLRPTDGRSTWLVVTRWRDTGAFEAWVASGRIALLS